MTLNIDQGLQSKVGFRGLRVAAKIVESSLITSFHLEEADGLGLASLPSRSVSGIQDPVGDPKGYEAAQLQPVRLARRSLPLPHFGQGEPSAGPGLPVGQSSNYLHDNVCVGDVLIADGPRGEFVLDDASDRPAVLFSGGVGLTPMVAMLHALVNRSARRTLFLHACENGEVHALRDEVNGLISRVPACRPITAIVRPVPKIALQTDLTVKASSPATCCRACCARRLRFLPLWPTTIHAGDVPNAARPWRGQGPHRL